MPQAVIKMQEFINYNTTQDRAKLNIVEAKCGLLRGSYEVSPALCNLPALCSLPASMRSP